MTGWYNSSWRARFLEYRKEGDGWSHPLLLCDKTHRRRTMMSGDDRQNSPSISRQNRPSATVIHDRVPVQKVEPMTDRDYSVRGCTALLDAIGGAIHHIGNVHKYARKEDVPEHTLFVITTDGMENASRRYDSEKVKKMIERQKEKYGWEFLFLGANIDAVETARHFGIGADRAVNYHSDHEGTQLNYEVLSEAVSAVRCSVPLGTNWKKRIDEDFNSRKDGRKQ